MKYSLINVRKQVGDVVVDGNWIQDHVGTLETAIQKAKRTEEVNSHNIDVAVVEQLASTVDFPPRKRLDRI